EEFGLAQLYSDLAGVPEITQQMKNHWYECAWKVYDKLVKPSDPYVFHQHATFLLMRAESLMEEYSKAVPTLAEPKRKQAKKWAREALGLLNDSIQGYNEMGNPKPQLIANCHFYRGYAYGFLGQLDD